MTNTKTKYHSFENFRDKNPELNLANRVLDMRMMLYEKAKAKSNPIILELGTHKGISTTLFLQVTQENGGKLYSVDIRDYSDTSDDKNWTFIQASSTDVDAILEKHPELKNGIDILLIDSLHKQSHVEKELYGWFSHLNENALIFFDDLDSNPYRKNHKKDDVYLEFDNKYIHDCILDAYHNNEDICSLEVHYGSTGLAILEKKAPLGTPLKQKAIMRRTDNCFWKLRVVLLRMKQNFIGEAY